MKTIAMRLGIRRAITETESTVPIVVTGRPVGSEGEGQGQIMIRFPACMTSWIIIHACFQGK